jgi:hypothetical protein
VPRIALEGRVGGYNSILELSMKMLVKSPITRIQKVKNGIQFQVTSSKFQVKRPQNLKLETLYRNPQILLER